MLQAAVAMSLLLHLISYVNLTYISKRNEISSKNKNKNQKVKINFIAKNKDKKLERILETKQTKTEAPEKPRFKGAQNHKTEKETKVSKKFPRPKAADPGQAKNGSKKPVVKKVKKSLKPKKIAKNPSMDKRNIKRRSVLDPNGKVSVKGKRKPRNQYEALMPSSVDLVNQVTAGYQDYIDDELEESEQIDINTSDYRYIGYFTAMRKAFELVWTYPSEAVRRGLQGEVRIQFTILKDGSVKRVKVVSSSGHRILDDAVVEAIKLASPYNPLPEGLNKEKLVIVGSFSYVLSSYLGSL